MDEAELRARLEALEFAAAASLFISARYYFGSAFDRERLPQRVIELASSHGVPAPSGAALEAFRRIADNAALMHAYLPPAAPPET
jgi:hypothetical protein